MPGSLGLSAIGLRLLVLIAVESFTIGLSIGFLLATLNELLDELNEARRNRKI